MPNLSVACAFECPAAHLPPHLRPTRAAVMAAQEQRAKRVQLLPPARGRIGRAVGPKRIVCRVVGQQRFSGMTKWKLRCNAGVLKDYAFPAAMEKAPADAAAKLTFSGIAVAGAPIVSLDKAWAAEVGAGTTVKCRCRGNCGKSCSCRKAGVQCSRSCGCKLCTGANCGNH